MWFLAVPVVYAALSVAVTKAGKMAGTPTITFNLTPAPTPVPTPTPLPVMLDHHARWQQLFVSRDQKQIFSAYAPFQSEPLDDGSFIGDADGQFTLIRVWNARTGKPLYNIPPQEQDRDFDVSDDGTLLLANPTDNGPAVEPVFNTKVFSAVYNAYTGVKLWTLPEGGYVSFAPGHRDLWFLRARPTSPDSEHFIEQVEVRDAQSGKLQRHFSLPEAFLDSSTSYVWRRDGGAFALVSTEHASRLWSISARG